MIKLNKQKIIIADDETAVSSLLKEMFDNNGWDASVAASGDEVLDMVDKDDFHMILLDLKMPSIDGFEVIRRIKSNPEKKHISIVVLTNSDDEEDMHKAMLLGASDYCLKTDHSLGQLTERINNL